MKRTQKKKDIQLVFGKLLAPLKVGKSAAFLHTGGLTRTSPVCLITQINKVNVVFETENSVYCLSAYLPPAALRRPVGAAA